jgi:hypothetical protein
MNHLVFDGREVPISSGQPLEEADGQYLKRASEQNLTVVNIDGSIQGGLAPRHPRTHLYLGRMLPINPPILNFRVLVIGKRHTLIGLISAYGYDIVESLPDRVADEIAQRHGSSFWTPSLVLIHSQMLLDQGGLYDWESLQRIFKPKVAPRPYVIIVNYGELQGDVDHGWMTRALGVAPSKIVQPREVALSCCLCCYGWVEQFGDEYSLDNLEEKYI